MLEFDSYKYLFVSSPDEMDIIANVKRLCDLYFQYLGRFYAQAKFLTLLGESQTRSLPPEEAHPCPTPDSNQLEFYSTLKLFDEEWYLNEIGRYDGKSSMDQHYKTLVNNKDRKELAPREPQDFIHLIVNKSAHLESFGDKKVDLRHLYSTVYEIFINHKKKKLTDWKIKPRKDDKHNAQHQAKEYIDKILVCLERIILIHFDPDLFFYFQAKILTGKHVDTSIKDKKTIIEKPEFTLTPIENLTAPAADFGELCYQDSRLYKTIYSTGNGNSLFKDSDKDIFLHSLRIIMAFKYLFVFFVNSVFLAGDMENKISGEKVDKYLDRIAEHLDRVAGYVSDTILQFLPELDSSLLFNEKRADMVDCVLKFSIGLDNNPVQMRHEYFGIIEIENRELLKNYSVAHTLTILFTAPLFFMEEHGRKLTSFCLKRKKLTSRCLKKLPELFATIQNGMTIISDSEKTQRPETDLLKKELINRFLSELPEERVSPMKDAKITKEAPPDMRCLEVRFIVENLVNVIFSLDNFTSKSNLIIENQTKINSAKIGKSQKSYYEQLLIILFCHSKYSSERILAIMNSYHADSSSGPLHLVNILIREKLRELGHVD